MKKFLFFIATLLVASSVLSQQSSFEENYGYEVSILNDTDVIITKYAKKDAIATRSFVVCKGYDGENPSYGSIDAITDGELKKDVFQVINDRPLDWVNSMTIIDDKAFIVVNNSNSGKVEAVNAYTFKSEGTCTGLSYPRYVANRNNNEIFVSNGSYIKGDGDDYVYVVNKHSMQKTDSVATGGIPNSMVVSNGHLFVANYNGSFLNFDESVDKTVTVIDTKTLKVEKIITVGDCPCDMEVDARGNIIVLCKGLTVQDADWNQTVVSNTAICTINASSLEATVTNFFDHKFKNDMFDNLIAYNNGTIYYVDDAVYSLANGTITKLIDGSFDGISTSENGDIWVTEHTYSIDSYSYVDVVKQYDKNGKLIKTYNTSRTPDAVIFGTDVFIYANASGNVTIPSSVTINDKIYSVTAIAESAFSGCSTITSVTIPNGITTIEAGTFSNCSALTSVTIPGSVTKVGENAFSGCTALKNVTCLATVPPTAYANSFENYNGYLSIPCESKDDYDFASCWGSFKHVDCIGSETVELTKDEVAVVPEKTEAVFSMPKNENANTYTLTIQNNGVTFCTLTFNAQGQLANIDFSTTKSYELKSDVAGFQFTVTGLSTASDYGYSFKALASNKSVLKEYAGSFTTKNENGTGGSAQGGGEIEGSGQGGQGGSTAISEVSNATAVTIVNGQILVNGEAPAFVVTISGQKIANANLKAGVYFVVADGKTVGVSVR